MTTDITVTAGGTTVPLVSDVSYDDSEAGISTATISVGNTASNRGLFESGTRVEIYENADGSGDPDFVGEVISKPSNNNRDNLTTDIEIEGGASRLEYAKVNRPLIQLSDDEMVERVVNTRAKPERIDFEIHTGDDLTGWSSNGTDFELLDSVADVTEVGDDSIYVGIRAGGSGTYFAQYDGPVAPGRRMEELRTRLLIADNGGNFTGRVIYVDGDDIQYEWDIGLTGTAENKLYKLPVEDAEVITEKPDYPAGTIRYEVSTGGTVPEPRAYAIDSAKAVLIEQEDRDFGITVDADPVDYVTTRRIDDSALSFITDIAQDNGFSVVVDGDTLRWGNAQMNDAGLSIEQGDPNGNIVDVAVDRDFDVRNQVTIQGSGDLRESFESTQSINFYNEAVPKQEAIEDPSIRTRTQAKRRARGFLADNAFDDGAITFTTANADYRALNAGELIAVNWPKEDINGVFHISGLSRSPEGYTSINLSGNISI